MQRFTLLIGCFLLGFLPINAQEVKGVCGNTYADQMSQIDRYLVNKKIRRYLIIFIKIFMLLFFY